MPDPAPTRPSRPSRRSVLGAAAVAVAGPGALATAARAAGVPLLPVTSFSQQIPVRDGVLLQASVALPQRAGRWPFVVLPGTFAGDSIRLDAVGKALAAHGYVTVAYLERGFGRSEGLVQGAGPLDVTDVGDVITWAHERLPVDRPRTGAAGLSYGAGIAQLAALVDPRIKVVASLSGWSDMVQAFYPNRSRAVMAFQGLLVAMLAVGGGRPSQELLDAFTSGIEGTDVARTVTFGRARSASTLLDTAAGSLRARSVPLFVSVQMNETVFPVDQSLDFWRAWPGPKHLDLRPGDHANVELVAVGDRVGPTWEEAFRWFDAHLAGTDPSMLAEPAVRVVPRSPFGFRPVERGADVVPSRTRRLYLRTEPAFLGQTLTLGATPGPAAARLHEGVNVVARPLFPLYLYSVEANTGIPPTIGSSFVDGRVSRMWTTPVLTSTLRHRGALELDLWLRPSAARGSVVALTVAVPTVPTELVPIARQPYAFSGATPGRPLRVRFALPYNAIDVPAGYRLGVVLSTSDISWATQNPPGATIDVLPESSVVVPLR